MTDNLPEQAGDRREDAPAEDERRRPYQHPTVKTSEAFESVSTWCCKNSLVAAPTS